MNFLVVHEPNLHEIAVDTPADVVETAVVAAHSHEIDVEDVENLNLVFRGSQYVYHFHFLQQLLNV